MYFDIARESADISFDDFCLRYYDTEQPVILEKTGIDWPARTLWNESYIREKLSRDSSAKAASLWYWMERGTLSEDYFTPDIIDRLLDSPRVFPRSKVMRIWIHDKKNISNWHYDGNMVNVFNVQITGKKDWYLVSPETPLDCYPFTSFGIIKGNDDKLLKNKTYTHFTLYEGDMLYIPALWFHKVIACDEKNINLNWIFTKKETTITSKTFNRELERYFLRKYLSEHRYTWVRNAFGIINNNLPGYLKLKWRCPEMIKSPYQHKQFTLTRRAFRELSMLGKVLWHVNKIRPYIDSLKSIRKLEKESTVTR